MWCVVWCGVVWYRTLIVNVWVRCVDLVVGGYSVCGVWCGVVWYRT